MTTLSEFGKAIHQRRTDMGLTQSKLASMSGLSRQTLNQLERGSLSELGMNKASTLADLVGLHWRIDDQSQPKGRPHAQKMSALGKAAISGSVSYRTPITEARLSGIFKDGVVPDVFAPHVHAILDDAPVSLLAGIAEQLRVAAGMEPKAVWANFRKLAKHVHALRELWQ